MSRVELVCDLDFEQTFDSFHAHAIPDGADINPGDILLLHGVPEGAAFGEHFTGQCRATLIRANVFTRLLTQFAGIFALPELYEVGFQPKG